MLPEALGLELESLSTLQRKLLIELIQRRHPQYWSKITSHRNSWQSQRETLEEFIQNHRVEILNALAGAGLNNNGWKPRGDAERTSTLEHYREPCNGRRIADRVGKAVGVKLVGGL